MIDRWKSVAQAELDRLSAPMPPELVLAVIKRESGGTIGAVNPSSGASGLMQVMPIALKDYNNHHSTQITMADLKSKTDAGAVLQIRVGVWILCQFWRSAYKYLKARLSSVALDDLTKIADFFYAAGPGNARKKLDTLAAPTFAAAAAAFPDWDRIAPAQRIWDFVTDSGAVWPLQKIDSWLEGQITPEKKPIGSAIVIIILVGVAWYIINKGFNNGG